MHNRRLEQKTTIPTSFPQRAQWFSPNHYQNTYQAQRTLEAALPAIYYGIDSCPVVGYEHALTEAVSIGYLLGQGYDYQTAVNTVQSWWRPS
ncbi:hypothetical protein AJ85_13905 [Alkalihalobacillus alcalophilus ATCC 27647 = CGMCC 1.3604]|uniref:Uncharacterized protein n=1 Tax=Alkalihalobacillus alcalophilus ATCC 27647 = CGMCC 1.3604 TaxID=1218173 RepID=A0A4S4JXR9_ALKAL|nr:hypothetical protein [Alkalihalobacillus alcalophilus]MED1564012.1 hypothetical protein [Alkalihalobacillus alcalophilus]THG90028.1 hypothetical protein AJ85_13905 [Alkalihalobacillus alcalophilus ATCC 27647 = CGMCC 1.3604]